MLRKLQRVNLLAAILVLLLASTVTATPPDRGSWIVVFHGNVGNPGAVANEMAQRAGGQVGFVYEHALKGFSIELPAAAAAGLRNDPRVAFVEVDLPMQITAQETPTGIQRMFAANNTNLKFNGIDERVDVDVAVLDTGIDLQHPDLNVAGGIDCTLKKGGGPFANYYCGAGNGGDDDHYHGTHVAGTIGALDNGMGVVGVAPGARLWAVKVLNSQGSGYTSGIVAGIDWVVGQGNIEVINMSLGGEGKSTAYETAINNAVSKGVVVVVAAGNSNADANNYSPAFVPSAITVSALADFNGQPGGGAAPTCRPDVDDTLADFSNWGSAVDIAAPGVCILSTYPIEQGNYATISGTSMAAPHVAGAAALLASTNRPTNAAGVQAIRDTLVNSGNLNWVDDSGDGIQERLLDVTTFNAAFVGGGGGSNVAPTASFIFACTNLSCNFNGSASSDSDGSIASYAWNFGNGSTGSGATPSHTYATAGTYAVSLTVTDNGGAAGTVSQNVTVTAPSSGGITLTATGYKVKGLAKADLSWSGASSTAIDIHRNGSIIVTVANSGAWTDNINQKGGGTYTYKVCEIGTNTCSNEVTVNF